jgi:hypothetical protein
MARNRIRRSLLALALAPAVLSAAAPAQARPMTPLENRDMPYATDMPACNDPMVLGTISSRFSSRETYWDSGLSIVGYDRFAEVGYRSNGLDYLARRFCMARVTFNNGKSSKLTYAIGGSDTGWLGVLGFGVQWCIEGLDRNFAYGGECRAARP